MNPTERVIATIEGREPDRVPTFSYYMDNHPVEQVLGKQLLASSFMILNPIAGFVYEHWGKSLKRFFTDPILSHMMLKSIEAATRLGFDAVVGLFEPYFIFWDKKTLARSTGSFYDMIDDGHGTAFYMYRGPAFKTRADFDEWPYFPDPDDLAHKTYRFFRKVRAKYGDKICVMGQASFGIHETMLWSFGFERLPVFIRKEPEMIKRYIALLEAIIMKTNMAMMDAGLVVIFDGDDFSFKTGPMMNPKHADELFGPSYARITDAVHKRGGKILLHSCGDNTMLFDYFIKWGFDGGHAYENTSNVDIAYEKKTHGDHFTIMGNIGVDYLLTKRSKSEEVTAEVKRLIQLCAPGGRFILGPTHDHPDMDIEKVRVMVEAARKYGKYPIQA